MQMDVSHWMALAPPTTPPAPAAVDDQGERDRRRAQFEAELRAFDVLDDRLRAILPVEVPA